MLVESKHIPADLIYNSPPDEFHPHGTVEVVDLTLPKYDKIAARFNSRREEAVSALKDGIDTRNAAFNLMIGEIEHVAVNTTKPILLLGPTGAGKSRLASRDVWQLVYGRPLRAVINFGVVA
jgi:transcriptional regulatory protein RtcR